MQWEPDHHGWMAYIKFELRGGEASRARAIYERYVVCLPTAKAWVRYAKFEAENGSPGRARQVYERALQVRLGMHTVDPDLQTFPHVFGVDTTGKQRFLHPQDLHSGQMITPPISTP